MFKVGFNSLIKILSWMSSLKLHKLLARIEKSSGQTTALQKIIWSCMAEVWELFFTHFSVSGETPVCFEFGLFVGMSFGFYQFIEPLHEEP